MRFKEYAQYFTQKERDKRTYAKFKEEIKYYEDMETNQILEHYVNAESEFKYKQAISSLCGIALLISILTGLWKEFYNLLSNTLNLYFTGEQAAEETRIVILLSLGLITVVFAFILLGLIVYLKNMHRLYRKLLIIEVVKNKQLKKEDEEVK